MVKLEHTFGSGPGHLKAAVVFSFSLKTGPTLVDD